MAAKFSQYQLRRIHIPSPMASDSDRVRISPYPIPCNEVLSTTICHRAYLTSCSDSHLSRMFRHWMRHCSTLKSSPSGCAVNLVTSTPIIQHVAGWDSLYHDFGVRKPDLLVVQGWGYFILFAEPQVMALLKEANVVLGVWLITCQRIVEEGQRPAVR